MIVRTVLRKTVAALAVLALAGCGSRAASSPDREWQANARGVAQQLRQDVVAIAGLDRVPVARRALHDDSQLYGLLVSYTDFGGCAHMVAALGEEPRRLDSARRLLALACRRLRAADAFFTRAVARNDPRLLVRATKLAERSLAPLEQAQLALDLLHEPDVAVGILQVEERRVAAPLRIEPVGAAARAEVVRRARLHTALDELGMSGLDVRHA